MRFLQRLLILCLLSYAPATALADAYDDAFAQARALERQGSFEQAAEQLRPLLHSYPQDYALALQLAWLEFQAGAYDAALSSYLRAEQLSEGASDATLGRGWTLFRLERYDEAQAAFRELLVAAPEHAGAVEGLAAVDAVLAVLADAAAPAPSSSFLALAASGSYHDYNASLWGLSAGVRAAATVDDHYLFGANYRFARYTSGSLLGSGRNASRQKSSSIQHEVYAHLGYAELEWGVLLQYAASLGDDEAMSFHAFGGSLRWSRWGKALLEWSLSLYPDLILPRLAPSWHIGLGSGFSLTPGAWLQTAQQQFYGGGLLSLGWSNDDLGLAVGGKFGDELRPLYLALPAVLNLPGIVSHGAWASVSLGLPADWHLALSYEYDRMSPDKANTQVGDALHFFTLELGTKLGFL